MCWHACCQTEITHIRALLWRNIRWIEGKYLWNLWLKIEKEHSGWHWEKTSHWLGCAQLIVIGVRHCPNYPPATLSNISFPISVRAWVPKYLNSPDYCGISHWSWVGEEVRDLNDFSSSCSQNKLLSNLVDIGLLLLYLKYSKKSIFLCYPMKSDHTIHEYNQGLDKYNC